MTRADKIRSMTDKELTHFMFKYSIREIAAFFEKGGAGCMNIPELADYLSGEYSEEKDALLNDKPMEDEDETP